MPAIQMARLKTQVDLLARSFMQPAEFSRALLNVLEIYANRVYRPGQAVPPTSLAPSYHAPRLVMLQLQTRLRSECLAHPEEALRLADTLWLEPMLEPRLLAAFLMGQLQVNFFDAVTERLLQWGCATDDHILLQTLLNDGTVTIRQKAAQKWLATLQGWITNGLQTQQKVGLQALLPLITDLQFQNLPAVYNLISPLLQAAPPDLQNVLQVILQACAQRSPVETGFYLRQLLMTSNTPGLSRMVRRIMSHLPAASQANLRSLLQTREN